MVWRIAVGQTLRRREVHEVLGGGSRQDGIAPVAGTDEILVFTDPDAGRAHGYDRFEGLREDGSYSYTGAGQHGDQVFLRGNRALAESPTTGRNIRLFRTRGTLATYVGPFTLGDPGWGIERIPDSDGELRNGIVFNLVPTGAAQVEELPLYGEAERNGVVTRVWHAPSFDDYAFASAPPDAEARRASRAEFALQADFGNWLRGRGDDVRSLRLPIDGNVIQPDLYNATTGELIEAKRSIARGDVRTAIGQVLDYENVARRAGMAVAPSILLPGQLPEDLLALCTSLGITVWVRDGSTFQRFTP